MSGILSFLLLERIRQHSRHSVRNVQGESSRPAGQAKLSLVFTYVLFQTVSLAFVFRFWRWERRGYVLPQFGVKTADVLVRPAVVDHSHLMWCSVSSVQKEAPS